MKYKKTDYLGSSNYGRIIIFISLLILIPIFIVPFFTEDIIYILAFACPCIIAFIIGIFIIYLEMRYCRHFNYEGKHSTFAGGMTVLFAWIFGIILGSIPFVLGKQLGIVQALFEAVSAWTTTGLSVMDIANTPKIYLFYRSFMQFCGGLGFILMLLLIVSDKQSMNLFNAEGHPDKLKPNLKKTAQTIFFMYSIFLFLGIILYMISGLDLFESICHSMCALSTGGFSTRINSIGEYNNILVEIVTMILMLIGTTNFAALLLLSKGKLRRFISISEVKFMFVLLFLFISISTIILRDRLNMEFIEGLRQSVFNLISALSTAGFSTTTYNSWPETVLAMIILLMLIGGGIGSTAGGIKLTRVYLMLKIISNNIKKRIYSSRKVDSIYYIKAQGKTLIDNETVDDTVGYVFIYILLFIIGSMLICYFERCSLIYSMFEFASALGTVGLSIGITNPDTGSLTLIIEIFGMILGRLEIFIVWIGFYSIGKTIYNNLTKIKK